MIFFRGAKPPQGCPWWPKNTLGSTLVHPPCDSNQFLKQFFCFSFFSNGQPPRRFWPSDHFLFLILSSTIYHPKEHYVRFSALSSKIFLMAATFRVVPNNPYSHFRPPSLPAWQNAMPTVIVQMFSGNAFS